ncbi:unnamed protein product [Schistosoma mattheei]|uniref:Uncharacterized protein n=1 Tax=Schistosoma mattheei TaxID=31246 RepID=A0AA85BTU4_9TREM|nr:unnamed protein product [Schistosoma mattheei]
MLNIGLDLSFWRLFCRCSLYLVSFYPAWFLSCSGYFPRSTCESQQVFHMYTLSSQEVEVQLDILNKTSTQINDLERRLEISRDVYRKVLSDQSDKLQKLSKKLGKCIIRTRPYNELKQKQAHYRKEIQMAALKYENAISTLSAARDTLAKLEACVSEPGVRDPNLLESLNQSITDFNNANKSLNNAKLEHEKLMEIYATNEQSLRCLEKRLRFDIQKAKPYYTMYDHFMLKMEDAKTHVELCTDKLKACKIIYSDAMCKLELLSNSIHTKRLNQNDHSNNEYSHSNNNNNNNNMDDYVIMKSFSKQYESIQYTNEYSNNQFMKDNTLNKSNNDCLNVTIVDHLNMDNHNHNTDNDNSTVNCFPIMNGLFESLHQASIEIDSLQNSPFLSSIHSKDYCNSTTNSYCTTIDTNTITTTTTTTMTTSSLCTENNSYRESLSLSSHTSSASISPALSFDTFTTSSLTTTTSSSSSSPLSSSSLLFDEQSSTLMLMNSFNNLNLTNNSSHSFISKEICCSNFTITNSS